MYIRPEYPLQCSRETTTRTKYLPTHVSKFNTWWEEETLIFLEDIKIYMCERRIITSLNKKNTK